MHSVTQIALPITLQSVLAMLVNLADTVMVGRLGTDALAGVSQANQVFFIVAMTIPGIAAGASVLLSQAWGRGNLDMIYRVLAYAFYTAVGFCVVVMAICIASPDWVLRIFTSDDAAFRYGTDYLKIVAWSYIFYTLTQITTGVLRSVRSVNVCLYSAIVSIVLNISLNYILIYGRLGFPAMGVAGAAAATVIARIGEYAVILIYVTFFEKKILIRPSKIIRLDGSIAGLFFKTAAPVICNEMFWGLGSSSQAIVLGHLGNSVVSGSSVASSVMQIATVICQGLSAACCIIIGNNIGKQNLGIIPILKRFFQILAVVFGCISSVILFFLVPLIEALYGVSGQTAGYARDFIYIYCFIIPFMELQSMSMMGLLRGAGDVNFQMANDLVFLWGFTVPVGFILAYQVHAPVQFVYFMLRSDQIIKVFTSEWRLRKGRWIHVLDGSGSRKAMTLEEVKQFSHQNQVTS